MSTPMPRGGRRVKLTRAQYANLRYWAGCSVDQPDYVAANGPAPAMQPRTLDSIAVRGWGWLHVAHGGQLIVTDLGRKMAGLPPVHRDKPCPLPLCQARAGERCRHHATGEHDDSVHEARAALQTRHTPSAPTRMTGSGLPYDPNTSVGFFVAT
jgi:hypothetical protein